MSPDAMRMRLALLGRRLGFSARGVIVNNNPEHKGVDDPDWAVIAGSNDAHAFSAYREGLNYLEKSQARPQSIVFANDSLFSSHHPRVNMKALIRQLQVLEKIQCPALAGKTESYHTYCHANPWSGLGIFVSTYCFALNRSAFPILLELKDTADGDLQDGESTVSIQSLQWGSGLTATFREFIRGFLLYQHPDYRWPGADAYQLNDRLVMKKARCIYMEHRLSGEVGRHGCILPTNLTRMDRIRIYVGETGAKLMRSLGVQFK